MRNELVVVLDPHAVQRLKDSIPSAIAEMERKSDLKLISNPAESLFHTVMQAPFYSILCMIATLENAQAVHQKQLDEIAQLSRLSEPQGFSQAARDVLEERAHQDAKWGKQWHQPFAWLSILGEEMGEACQAANEANWQTGNWANYRAELIQVAATALNAVETFDRLQAAKAEAKAETNGETQKDGGK